MSVNAFARLQVAGGVLRERNLFINFPRTSALQRLLRWTIPRSSLQVLVQVFYSVSQWGQYLPCIAPTRVHGVQHASIHQSASPPALCTPAPLRALQIPRMELYILMELCDLINSPSQWHQHARRRACTNRNTTPCNFSNCRLATWPLMSWHVVGDTYSGVGVTVYPVRAWSGVLFFPL